jgi:hypothetical protein
MIEIRSKDAKQLQMIRLYDLTNGRQITSTIGGFSA